MTQKSDERLKQERHRRFSTVKKHSPSVANLVLASLGATAHLVLTHLVAAGEISGAWDKFGGMGSQLRDLANVVAAAIRTNQETASRRAEDQDTGRQQIARGRHDIKQIASKVNRPSLPRVARVTDGRPRDFASRTSDKGREDRFSPKGGNRGEGADITK